jgi:ribonuclease P protein component
MITRTHRFHGRGSIARTYTAGKSVRTGAVSLRYAHNPTRREYRAAVVVSRKVSKSAVVRNRIRRRIYERVRILSTEFTSVYDLVFSVYDEKIATMPAAELDKELKKLAAKAGLTSAT